MKLCFSGNDYKYEIEGVMKLDDINDAIHTALESEDYDSIGGLMIGALDRIPHNRESVTLADGTVLTARGIKQNRILKVLLTLPAKEEDVSSVTSSISSSSAFALENSRRPMSSSSPSSPSI